MLSQATPRDQWTEFTIRISWRQESEGFAFESPVVACPKRNPWLYLEEPRGLYAD